MLPEPILTYLNQAARDARVEMPELNASLFQAGLLDSFSLVEFVTLIETECGIRVSDAELKPDNFDSLAKIETFVAKAGVSDL